MVKIGNRTFTKIKQWQVEYIKEHYQDKLTEIGQAIGIDSRRVSEIIKQLGLKRERHWKIYLPKTREVEEKLKNPYLSHVEIAKEFGVSETCVAKRRKEMGLNSRRKNYDTLIEKELALLLDQLDLVYFKQKKIKQWSIDFYLGRKFCIDVHGTWSHSKNKIIERDQRKKEFLKNSGYKYLVIAEKDLEDRKKVLNKLREFTLGFPHS